jgi:hypothetical protein
MQTSGGAPRSAAPLCLGGLPRSSSGNRVVLAHAVGGVDTAPHLLRQVGEHPPDHPGHQGLEQPNRTARLHLHRDLHTRPAVMRREAEVERPLGAARPVDDRAAAGTILRHDELRKLTRKVRKHSSQWGRDADRKLTVSVAVGGSRLGVVFVMAGATRSPEIPA